MIQSITKPERIYVGSAIDIHKRWGRHKSELRHGIHHSPTLQRHYDKYGEDDLKFMILEQFDFNDPRKIEERENSYLQPKPYFNGSYKANSCAGYKHTKKARKNMSIAQRRIWDNKVMSDEEHQNRSNGQLGKKRRLGQHNTIEHNKKIGNANKGRKPAIQTIEAAKKANIGRIPSKEELEKRSIGLLRSWETRDKTPLNKRPRDERGHWIKGWKDC